MYVTKIHENETYVSFIVIKCLVTETLYFTCMGIINYCTKCLVQIYYTYNINYYHQVTYWAIGFPLL